VILIFNTTFSTSKYTGSTPGWNTLPTPGDNLFVLWTQILHRRARHITPTQFYWWYDPAVDSGLVEVNTSKTTMEEREGQGNYSKSVTPAVPSHT